MVKLPWGPSLTKHIYDVGLMQDMTVWGICCHLETSKISANGAIRGIPGSEWVIAQCWCLPEPVEYYPNVKYAFPSKLNITHYANLEVCFVSAQKCKESNSNCLIIQNSFYKVSMTMRSLSILCGVQSSLILENKQTKHKFPVKLFVRGTSKSTFSLNIL